VLPQVQGTVAEFDETAHDGSLLLDDGTTVTFPASAFAASGLRLLRLGQRVRVERSATGVVTLVTLITLP
jgi:2-phospho-L-lactate guanylyltransferase